MPVDWARNPGTAGLRPAGGPSYGWVSRYATPNATGVGVGVSAKKLNARLSHGPPAGVVNGCPKKRGTTLLAVPPVSWVMSAAGDDDGTASAASTAAARRYQKAALKGVTPAPERLPRHSGRGVRRGGTVGPILMGSVRQCQNKC